ncbi:MAG: ATP-binding cassette domain-containing protein [Eubacteriales bacterium]
MTPVISVKNLSKQYISTERGGSFREAVRSLFIRKKIVVTAVEDVSFEIEEGSITGLLGKNGAGKSTLIKMMTGVLYPSSGEVRVMGYDPFKERSKYVSNIGVMFGQKSQLIWDIPPIDSFLMNKAIYGVDNKSFQAQLDRMSALLEVESIMKKPTRQLSLGERMKCEFIMAMLHSPRVVFLDEPTIGLDLIAKESIRNFVLEMNRQGVSFVLTTHDIEDVERLAQKVIIINKGQKVYEDTLQGLKTYVGNKKNVRILMKDKFPQVACEGIEDIKDISEYEKELLIDRDRISVNDLLWLCENMGEIADIGIKEMSVEEIIKSIYSGN